MYTGNFIFMAELSWCYSIVCVAWEEVGVWSILPLLLKEEVYNNFSAQLFFAINDEIASWSEAIKKLILEQARKL